MSSTAPVVGQWRPFGRGRLLSTLPFLLGRGTFLSIIGETDTAGVQGVGQIRMFGVSPAGDLTLTNLKLSGGSAASGGVIHSSMAAVTLNSCAFDDNIATDGDGGAVWVEGGELMIVGGEFSGNSASGNGGAVLATDAAVAIENGTRFEGNSAIEGGGLFCGGSENVTLLSAGDGASCSLNGVIFAFNNASSETILDYDNMAAFSTQAPLVTLYGGGGAAFYHTVVNITDSVFEYNYAQLSGGALFGRTDTAMAIDGATFENNFTPGFAGALAASTATLGGNTLFMNNSAMQSGGGVRGAVAAACPLGFEESTA